MSDQVQRVRDACGRAVQRLGKQLGRPLVGISNARTGAEHDVWLDVLDALDGMPGMTYEHRRQLADRAVELMRESEAQRALDVIVDAGPTPEDMRGEVVHGD
jgi:hypothetical protein